MVNYLNSCKCVLKEMTEPSEQASAMILSPVTDEPVYLLKQVCCSSLDMSYRHSIHLQKQRSISRNTEYLCTVFN